MVSKSVIVLLALVAVAAAVETPVKRHALLHAAPLPLAYAARYADDGSWFPGKYDPVAVPVAAPLAHVGVAPLAHVAPLAPFARVAHVSPLAAHWGYPLSDDGSYWAGKYGPEWQ